MTERKRILIVDDNIFDLNIGTRILEEHYEVMPVTSGMKLMEALGTFQADLIILDLEMPVIDGYELLQKLKDNGFTEHIPVILLTGLEEVDDNKHKGLAAGAVDYITKPFSKPILLNRVNHLLQLEEQKRELKHLTKNLKEVTSERNKTIEEMQKAILLWGAELVGIKSGNAEETEDLSPEYLRVLLDEMIEANIYPNELAEIKGNIDTVVNSAALHDIGKIAIPDNILQKLKTLEDKEYEQIKEHASYGKNIIESLKKRLNDQEFLEHAQTMAFMHHERWDGTGYPLGLKGEEIPLLARAMAIVDVYSALISPRAYRKAITHEETMRIIESGKGTLYDPELVTIFLSASDKLKEIK